MGASVKLSVERFESVVTTPRHALLRVRGWWTADEPATLPVPQLEVTIDGQVQRYAPLDPRESRVEVGREPRPWCCAYAVPAALVDERQAGYALVARDGQTALPAPIEGLAGQRTQAPEPIA